MSWEDIVKGEQHLTFDAGSRNKDFIGTLTIEPELRVVALVTNREALKLLKKMLGDRLYIADEDYR